MGGSGKGKGKGKGSRGGNRGKGKGKGGKGGSRSGGSVPRRGGGEAGKRARQNEQEALRNAKIEREVGYFNQIQQQVAAGQVRPPTENERAVFGTAGAVGINFDKYDELKVERSGRGSKDVNALESFDDLASYGEVPEFVLENIGRCRYSRPTPIQKHSIPFSIQGRDVMCCAQTGSGKTAAFLLPVVVALGQGDPAVVSPMEAVTPQMVVLAPTRELATQIHLEARKFCFGSGLRAVQVYGGAEVKPQMKELAFGVDLLVATPGRLIDFIDRAVISMSNIWFLVVRVFSL